MWILWLDTASLAAPEGCQSPVTRARVSEGLAAAEIAAVALDVNGLDQAVATVERDLACLDEALTPSDVAALFRLTGISTFVRGQESEALAWFLSARTLEPSYRLDAVLGGPLSEAWDGVVPATTPPAALPPPGEGWLVVDGKRAVTAPTDRRYVLQWFDGSGAARLNQLVEPGGPAPKYPVGSGEPVAPAPGGTVRAPKTSRTLLVSGVTAGVLGGAGLGAAMALKSAFEDSKIPSDEQPGRIAANRALGWSGYGLCVTAAGLGVGAVVVGRW